MIGLRFSSLLLLSLLLVHLVPLSTALSVAPPPAPAPVVLPYSLWRGFIPSSIRYSNLTGLAYLVGSDYWVGVNANPYVVIANLSDGRILHRQHYIEQQPDALQLEYVDHLVHDRAGQPPVLVVLLYSMAELRSYVLRADGWTGGQLSFTALALDVVALGVDSSGKLLYTTVMEGDVVSAVDMQAGYAVQLLNATQGVANLVAGAVHPISGALYLHDLLQTDTEERNRLLVLSPSNNSILATFTLPPLNPLQDALLTSSAAIDSSGHYLDLFVTILHPDNVRDYVIWQFDVSNGSSIGPPFRTYDSTVLTAEVELGGAVSAGPRGDDWLLVDSLSREVYYQRDAARNESVLVGLPLLLFNFHTAVDERGHVYISTGDERSISVLEVAPNGDLLGQYFAGAVDCGHAGFYAPIAGVLHHPALGRRVLVPQCNRTVQVYDGETRQWLGQQATNQTVNLVIIAVHNAKAQLFMTTDSPNEVWQWDLRTSPWTLQAKYTTGPLNSTQSDRIRALAVDERRQLLYAGEYWNGQLFVFALSDPSRPLRRYNYTSSLVQPPAPFGFTALALSVDGALLYASVNVASGEVAFIAVIDTSNGEVVQSLVYPRIDDVPYSNVGGLALDLRSDTLFVCHGEAWAVLVTRNISSYTKSHRTVQHAAVSAAVAMA